MGGGKNLHELPPVSALIQWGNSCKFLPPPNFYAFSYKKWTLVVFEKKGAINLRMIQSNYYEIYEIWQFINAIPNNEFKHY